MKTKSKPDVQTLISMKIPKYALSAIDGAGKGEYISLCLAPSSHHAGRNTARGIGENRMNDTLVEKPVYSGDMQGLKDAATELSGDATSRRSGQRRCAS